MAYAKVVLLGVLLALACDKSAEEKKPPSTSPAAAPSTARESRPQGRAIQSPAAETSPSGADSFPQEPLGFRSIHQFELMAHKSDSARTDSSTSERP